MKASILQHWGHLIGQIYNEIIEHTAKYILEIFLNMDSIQLLLN